MTRPTVQPTPPKVEFYGRGVKIQNARKNVGTPPAGGRQPGSTIKGFSHSSRRAMREFMLTYEPVNGAYLLDATFTVPGPPLDRADKDIVFNYWQKHQASRKGFGAIWRMEVQDRGSVHWHLMIVVPEGSRLNQEVLDLSPRTEYERGLIAGELIAQGWHKALKNLGPREFDPPHVVKATGQEIHRVDNLNMMPGASEYAVKVLPDEGGTAWLRYLADHASKSKQAQIAENMGRHWGKINVKNTMRKVRFTDERYMTEPQMSAFLRMMERLITGTVKAPAAPFGRKVGRKRRLTRQGTSVRFSDPFTVSRMIDQAREIRPQAYEKPGSRKMVEKCLTYCADGVWREV